MADLDGTLHRWFDRLGATAVAVRPDHYVLAAGPDAGEVARALLRVVAPPVAGSVSRARRSSTGRAAGTR